MSNKETLFINLHIHKIIRKLYFEISWQHKLLMFGIKYIDFACCFYKNS